MRQRDHTFLIKLKRNRRQQATSEFLRLSNLVSKLRCAEEAKCEVAFIGMKSKVCSGGENDRRVLGIQCGSVNFFFAGERHQLTDDGKEKKKAVNLNVRRQNESVADFSFQIQISMCQ